MNTDRKQIATALPSARRAQKSRRKLFLCSSQDVEAVHERVLLDQMYTGRRSAVLRALQIKVMG